MPELRACQHCAGTIIDPEQRTCPHCLEDLRTRSFKTREGLERFREDRRAHGAPVAEPENGSTTGLYTILLGLAATIMIVAGGTVAYGGVASGDVAQASRAIEQAIVPLAMGLGLFEIARRKRG